MDPRLHSRRVAKFGLPFPSPEETVHQFLALGDHRVLGRRRLVGQSLLFPVSPIRLLQREFVPDGVFPAATEQPPSQTSAGAQLLRPLVKVGRSACSNF
jgi:hypothetical protein